MALDQMIGWVGVAKVQAAVLSYPLLIAPSKEYLTLGLNKQWQNI